MTDPLDDSKRKILYVLDKSGFGGVQTIAYKLMKHDIPDVSMSFLFLRNVNHRYGMQEIQSDNVFYAKGKSKFGFLSFLSLVRIVREQKIDVVHMNGNKAIIFGYLLKKLFPGLHMLAHDHGGVHDYSDWYARLLKLFRKSYDSFVCVSRHRQTFYTSRCSINPNRVKIINNFVDTDRIQPLTRLQNSHERGSEPFTLGYVGGLSWLKGCDVLLRALPLLGPRVSNFRLLVAGDGPSRQELEELAVELGVEDKVTFLGFVADVAEVYSQLDLLIIPSRSEEGPICLYEAWAMQLPVVASNAPVLNERIKDRNSGVFFETEDPQSLANMIVEVHQDDDLRKSIASNGRLQIADLTVERYLSQLGELYLSL